MDVSEEYPCRETLQTPKEIVQHFPLTEYPLLPVRERPSTPREVSDFFHRINPDCCDIICLDVSCRGHLEELPLRFNRLKNKERISARCRCCNQRVSYLPGNP